MIALTQDRRGVREGYATVFIAPREVAAVVPNGRDYDNRSTVILNSGERIEVQDYPSEVASKLAAPAQGDAQKGGGK